MNDDDLQKPEDKKLEVEARTPSKSFNIGMERPVLVRDEAPKSTNSCN